jgi:hypothetical protein
MNDKKSFWTSVPGILTAIAALISSIGGLLVALHSIGVLPWSGERDLETQKGEAVAPSKHDMPPQKKIPTRVTKRVNGTANGDFGYPRLGGDPLVKTIVLQNAGQVVRIGAVGTISLSNEGPQVGPDGANIPLQEGYSRQLATPLQQASMNFGRLPFPRPDAIPQAGALFGALVPLHVADSREFNAVDKATIKGGSRGIPATSLFLIGSGPFEFTSHEPSVLFLGVNDPRAANNSGYFTVDIEVLP